MATIGDKIDLGTALDASPNAYMLLTPDLHYAGMNQAYLDVTNTRREDLVGQPLFKAFDAGPGNEAAENVRQLKSSLEKVLQTRQRDHLALIHYPIAVTLADGTITYEDRYWSATHTPILDEAGQIALILQHTNDVTELERLRQAEELEATPLSALDTIIGGKVMMRARAVQEDNRRLENEQHRLDEMFMQSPGFTAILSGPDHVIQMHNTAYGRLIGRDDVRGKTVREALPDLLSKGYFELLDRVFQTGETYNGRGAKVSFQAETQPAQQEQYVDFIYQPIRDPDGRVVGVFLQGFDVTEAVLADQRQKLMIDELNHRVKNTLATVQSIAMQTARTHADPRTFAETFQARIVALSHTHDLLTRSYWEGAELHDILRHETEAFGSGRISINGPRLPLGSAPSLSLGMILHELATNAAKYGALSTAEGRVNVDWSIADQTNRVLHLLWREIGGPGVKDERPRGFGTRLIERNVRHDLAGQVKLDYGSDGLVADFIIPLDRERPA